MFGINKSVSKLKTLKKIKQIEENDSSIIVSEIKPAKKSNKTKNVSANKKLVSGVIFMKNIPHGFYEQQMRDYFSQFGRVNRLRVSRNRKTGQSKKYAYIEFESEDVAKIVASTMNNYLMFDHILKCEFLDKSKIKGNLFRDWNKPFINTASLHKFIHNKNKTVEKATSLTNKWLSSVKKMEKKLSDMGIDFKCEIVNKTNYVKNKEVMIVYSSDDDIEFKTPPNAIRSVKRRKYKTRNDLKPSAAERRTPIRKHKPLKKLRFNMLPKFIIIRAATKKSKQ